jgi:hypothetical protein
MCGDCIKLLSEMGADNLSTMGSAVQKKSTIFVDKRPFLGFFVDCERLFVADNMQKSLQFYTFF